MLYEYEHCGEKFEKILPIAERDNVDCPKCGQKAKRLFPTGTHHVWVGPPEWAYAWQHGEVM